MRPQVREVPGTLVIQPERCRGCRSCQLACSFIKTGVFNPAKSMIVMERTIELDHAAPMICPLGCDLCGGDPTCAKACKYGAIVYERDGVRSKIVVRP